MKYDKNPQYFSQSVYAFFVLAAATLFFVLLQNISYFRSVLYTALDLMAPFFGAFAVAFLLNPIMKWIERVPLSFMDRPGFKRPGLKRALSILLTYALMIIVLYIFFSYVIPDVFRSLYGIVSRIPGFVSLATEWFDNFLVDYLMSFGITQNQIDEILGPIVQTINSLTAYIPRVLPIVYNALMKFMTSIKNIVLAFVISIYMLSGKERFLAQFKKSVRAVLSQKRADAFLSLCTFINKTFGGFVSGKVLDSLIIGILCFIGMQILKIPYAMLISVIVGVTNIIPYFGPFIGAIPSILLLLFLDPIKALWFAIFILVLQQFDGNVLGPKILGGTIGLSSFWIVFAILVCGGLFGLTGLFLGVPIFAVIYYLVKMCIEYLLKKRRLPVETSAYMESRAPELKTEVEDEQN